MGVRTRRARVAAILRERLGLADGDRVVFTAGLPFARASETNTVRIGTACDRSALQYLFRAFGPDDGKGALLQEPELDEY